MYVRKPHDILRGATKHSVLVVGEVRKFGRDCLSLLSS